MLTRKQEIENFIEMCRGCFGRYADGSGGCLKFYNILEDRFNDAKPYYDGNHVIAKIGNCFYDIDGCYDSLPNEMYMPLDRYHSRDGLANLMGFNQDPFSQHRESYKRILKIM